MSERRARDNGSANRQADQIKEELNKAEQRAIFLFVALVFGSWLLPEPARAETSCGRRRAMWKCATSLSRTASAYHY